jgi:hypothetical protein
MDNSGVKIDPVTGQPVKAESGDKAAETEKRENDLLKERAAWLDVSQTDAGRQLVEMVKARLLARVEALAKADPEAAAYVKILAEIGVKEGIAEAAAQALFEKTLRRKDT